MSQSKEDIIHDLNTLLQGTHMGSSTFMDYCNATQSKDLKKALNHALTIFRKHEEALIQHLRRLDEKQSENSSLGSFFAEFFEKIKAELANNDCTLLDYAIRGIDMALKAVQDFKKKHHGLQQDLLDAINDMEKDYRKIYQDLIDLKLE